MEFHVRVFSDVLLRAAALGTSVGTFLFLFVGDNWDTENIFLVPDLIVCVVLVTAAMLPSKIASAIMLLGFGIGVGVFSTATADYLVQGRFGIGAALGLTTSAVACLYLTFRPKSA